MNFTQKFPSIAGTFLLLLSNTVYANPSACMETNVGSFCIELLEKTAPGTVANFINYINDGDYIDSIFHRSVPEFIVQGGGFIITDDLKVNRVPADAAITNEFSASNLRGTVAMAKLGGDPNSATSQWFVNLADNSENLDAQNGGFTVFGKVSDEDMKIFDAIAALRRVNFGPTIANGALGDTPLTDYTEGNVKLENFIRVSSAKIVNPEPEKVAIYNAGRLTFAVDAGSFGKLSIAMDLIAVEPKLVFKLDPNSVTPLQELPNEFAVYSQQNLTLSMASVDVEGSFVVTNVVMDLTDPNTFTFTVVSMDQ